MQNQVQIDFDNENDDFCDENGNSFDDYGDENDQKTDKYHGFLVKYTPLRHYYLVKTSQELRMLSSVTLNCQATKIVMNAGSQLSEL